jgi:hypothetical protein
VQILASMRRTMKLPVRRLFCSHAYKVYDSLAPMQAKIERWAAMQREALRLCRQGAAIDAVTRQLAGPRRPIEWFSLGDYNRRNLVEGLIKGLI